MFKILLAVALLSAFADAKFSDITVRDLDYKPVLLRAYENKCTLVAFYGAQSDNDWIVKELAKIPSEYPNLELAVFPIVGEFEDNLDQTKKRFGLDGLKGRVFAPVHERRESVSRVFQFLAKAVHSDRFGNHVKYLVQKDGTTVTNVTAKRNAEISSLCN